VELTFTTTTVAFGMSVSTNTATNIGTTSATLQGTLGSLGGAPFSSVSFEYGTSVSYGATTAEVDVITTGTFNAAITGLFYNRTYHFRAIARYGTSYFYGADVTFITLSATGSSTDLQIITVAAFQNYLQTGDMLFTAEVINKYTGYYPTQKPGKYFSIQLLDPTGVTILAATPLVNWGDRPVSIYVNATQAAGLVFLENYVIKMIGTGVPANPSVSRQLTVDDWYGFDLAYLDSWCIGTATNMQLSDGRSDYLQLITNVGIVINNPAAGYFTTGIPGIGQVRPNLFTDFVGSATFPTGVATDVWHDPTGTAWQTFFGPIITADVGVISVPLGITGRDFLAGIVMFSILGCVMIVVGATGGWGALGAAMICLPILWLGVYSQVIEIAVLVAIIILAGAVAIRQFVVKTM